MLNLQNTATLVKQELERDLYILELCKEDIINISALARKLFPSIQKNNSHATVESIAVAIQRHISITKSQKISPAIQDVIASSQLSTKSDVIHITFKRNALLQKKIHEISQKIKWDEDEIFLVNQGHGEVTIIIDTKNAHLLSSCVSDEIERTKNLTIISVRENLKEQKKPSLEVPGVYAYFLTQLARKSITVISVLSTYTQITFAFRNNDFLVAYQTLEEAIAYFRNKKRAPT